LSQNEMNKTLKFWLPLKVLLSLLLSLGALPLRASVSTTPLRIPKREVVIGNTKPKIKIAQRKPASINRAVLTIVRPSKVFGLEGEFISPELIDTYNHIHAQQKPFDIGQIVPMDMQPSDNSNLIFSKIADRSVSVFMNSSEVRSTPFGKTTTSVEQKLKQDVTIEQGDIKHKIAFSIQAFQATARVDYTGYINATLKYQANEASTGLEVFETVSKGKDLVVSHTTKPDDRVSTVSMRWNF
jgi:hypothetical protein